MNSPFLELLARSRSSIDLDDGGITGPELVDVGSRLAVEWAAAGLRPGDRVGLWLPNSRGYLVGLAACAAGGFAAVSVNTRWSRDEADTLLGRSGARLLRTADEDRILDLDGGPAGDSLALEGDQPFVIFTTSGTTSRPKMVLHGQRSIVDHANDAGRAFGYGADTPVLVAMPLCGVFGLASLTAAMAADAPIIMPSAIVPAVIAATVEQRKVAAINGSDDLFHRMLATEADLSSIRVGGYARFNTSLDGIVARAEQRGMTLTGLYGMSEVQALYSLRDPSAPADVRERAGGTVVSPRAEVRVVDDELQLKGPSLFAGYLAEGGWRVDADLTNAHFADGWFRTGDAAVLDEPAGGGRPTFTYRTRMGDVLRLGGFLVAPSEIEAALIGFDGIDAAQVVSVDRPSGARPVAFVTGPFGVDGRPRELDEAAVIDHCAACLARYKVPIRVLVVDEFPTTPSANGTKIQKVKLREMAAAAVADDP
ncbi:MAG: AMP-binding protein [Acidimicrobiia bacterium]|nr:AMP-binding protein [Acidimicrobiia bacterium]